MRKGGGVGCGRGGWGDRQTIKLHFDHSQKAEKQMQKEQKNKNKEK